MNNTIYQFPPKTRFDEYYPGWPDTDVEAERQARSKLLDLAVNKLLPLAWELQRPEDLDSHSGGDAEVQPLSAEDDTDRRRLMSNGNVALTGFFGGRFYPHQDGQTDDDYAATISLYNPTKDITTELRVDLSRKGTDDDSLSRKELELASPAAILSAYNLEIRADFYEGKLQPQDVVNSGHENYFESDAVDNRRRGTLRVRKAAGKEAAVEAEIAGITELRIPPDNDVIAAAPSILVWTSNLKELVPPNAIV